MNGSPTKTQMVDSAGGRSQIASLVTAAIVVIVLLFLTKPLQYMPEAVLSAVVFLIGIELIKALQMKRIYQVRPDEFVVALITAAVVVVVGVEQGILLAMALSIVAHVRRSYRPNDTVLVTNDAGELVSEPVAEAGQAAPGLIIYRFGASLYYANAYRLAEEVRGLVESEGSGLRWFCIDASAISDIDYSASEALREIHKELDGRRSPARGRQPRGANSCGARRARDYRARRSRGVLRLDRRRARGIQEHQEFTVTRPDRRGSAAACQSHSPLEPTQSLRPRPSGAPLTSRRNEANRVG